MLLFKNVRQFERQFHPAFHPHMGVNKYTNQLLTFGPSSFWALGFTNTWMDQGTTIVKLSSVMYVETRK